MTLSEGALVSGRNYIYSRLGHEGDAYIIDIGFDEIHQNPIIFTSLDDMEAEVEDSTVERVFEPEHLARSYTPGKNVRVGIDQDFDNYENSRFRGGFREVKFYDVDPGVREEYRVEADSAYTPDDEALEEFYSLLNLGNHI